MSSKKILSVLVFLHSFSTPIWASDFLTTLESTYTLTSTSTVEAKQILSITNDNAVRFPTSFDLTIPSSTHATIRVVDQKNKPAHFETEKNDRFTRLTIFFSDQIVGLGKNQTYIIEYQSPSILFGTNNNLQFMLPPFPALDPSILHTTKLIIPQSACPTPIAFPPATTTETVGDLLTLQFSPPQTNQSIFVRCQDKRYVSVVLQYYLTNSNMTPIETQITLPPDTDYQHFYYEQINPTPLSIATDIDGNVIASFKLEPKESKQIVVNANAIIGSAALHSVSPPAPTYLTHKPFWPSANSDIKNISKQLADAESIYQYLMANTTLSQTSTSKRTGGGTLLKQPIEFQPIDLIDSFITLTRSKNIMSRRLIGFVQSPDSALWPTTLLEDTLHLWTEYYDSTKNQWVQLDPLWGKTSLSNFFPIHDLNHIVLAINGADDTIPYPVGYYQSPKQSGPDIQLTDITSMNEPPIQITAAIRESIIHVLGLSQKAELKISNQSLYSLYNEPITLTIDNQSPQLLTIHRLSLQGHAIIPITLPKTYDHITLTIKNIPFTVTSIKPGFNKPLIVAPIVALISGVFAIISRRLLVSRRKK